MGDVNRISSCEVCGSTSLTQVLDLGFLPLCDDLIPLGNPMDCEKFQVSILLCAVCITAHQEYQVAKTRLFPLNYHYRSRLTNDVLLGMDDLVRSVETRTGSLSDLVVLDIGCNDGSLLDRFSARGAKTLGVEPTGAAKDAMGREHIIFNDFFSHSTARDICKANPKIDVITFTNVFAHIEDLPGLLSDLSLLLSEDTVLIIENHYLGAVLKGNQFDTFYHEHPRTYSLTSFVHIARTLGREIIDVEFPQRYGGNVRVTIGNPLAAQSDARERLVEVLNQEKGFAESFKIMRSFVTGWASKKRSEILRLVEKEGSLIAKAFPGRAAILIGILGLTQSEIECVYEHPNSPKIGHYVPGTRIPIRSDEELLNSLSETKVILNLAWHIPIEIENYLRGSGFSGRLTSVM